MCVCVCVRTLDGLIAEHKFRVWVTTLGHMSRHYKENDNKKNSEKTYIAVVVCLLVMLNQ